MFRRSKFAHVLWVLAIALLAMRMSGEHLHLCLDGQEAAAAVHSLDLASHHADETQDEHQDKDLDLFGAALVKKSDSGEPLLPLLGVLVLLLLTPEISRLLPRAHAVAPSFALALYVMPPARGPPL